MARRSTIGLVVGALMALGTAWAQAPANPSAEQNVRQSRQYEQAVCGNPAFRAKRIAQECGPLQGSQFYNGCVASFECGARRPRSRSAPTP